MFAKRDLTQGKHPRGLLGFALPLILGNTHCSNCTTWPIPGWWAASSGKARLARWGSSYTLMTFFDLHSPGAVHGQQRLFFHSIRPPGPPTGCEMGFFSPFSAHSAG